MSKANRGLILAGAIIALCMSILFVITSIMNIAGIGLTIELIKAGAGFAAIFNLIRIVLTAVLAVLMLVYSIMLCMNPEKTGKFLEYHKKNLSLIVFVSIMLFIELLGIIILMDMLAIVDMLILTVSLVLLIIGFCKSKKEMEPLVAKQRGAMGNNVSYQQQGFIGDNNGGKNKVVQHQTFDCDLDNLIDHKVYRIRQLHADGVFTDQEMKELLIEVFQK